jgi:pyrroline-5-carboxylate reductase
MNALLGKRIAIVGVGNIGRILLERLTISGMPTDGLVICDCDPARAQEVSSRFGPRASLLTDETLCASDVFLLAAPPKAILEIIKALAPSLHPGQVVVSFAAAFPLSWLEALVPTGTAVVRVMPNAPSLMGKGINPVAYGSNVPPEARTLVEAVLPTLGEAFEVRDEQMNWCVGLTGAAMRSMLPALEGMTQAGVEAGFAEEEARNMAAKVMLGTATLVLESGLSFDEIKSMTPMETVDETTLRRIFSDAARAVKEKTDRLQQKLEELF